MFTSREPSLSDALVTAMGDVTTFLESTMLGAGIVVSTIMVLVLV